MWIKIQHNGTGLTADEQMNLFEPIFTGKSAAEDFDAGQRLSFSYYIVTEQHQGNMAVTSDVELGSTFHIQLPISIDALNTPPQKKPRTKAEQRA